MVVERLLRWATGVYAPGDMGRDVFVEGAALGDEMRLSAADVVFAPRGSGVHVVGPASVVPYDGALVEPGDELRLDGGFALTLVDYRSAAFRLVAGPTLVRVTSGEDWAAFVEDADLARSEGVFPAFLLDEPVVLGDLCALGGGHRCVAERLGRLHVDAAGRLRPAPGGATVERAAGTVNGVAGREICLAGVVADDVFADAVRARPWLGRYIAVLAVLRRVRRVRRGPVRVSGFGFRLLPGLAGAHERPDAPVLVSSQGQFLVVDGTSGRVVRVTPDAARVVELCQTAESPAAVLDRAADWWRLPEATARAAVTSVAAGLRAAGMTLPVEVGHA
ncbi:daptide biosynthesis RiPP recognition protein [Saccharothrix sp. NPDC042600]|uniref:daptide biosynthesis RiPP recognition protein n=1 Tax=Saccharothrix TaxID=2071 RepID=UPI0033DCBB9E|nr:hypothetical protein GCM10017745_45510 [Saccharothrix mutabilis subsp. capreolus]